MQIKNHIEFNEEGRGYCPSCTQAKGRTPSQRSLSLLASGAYKCHAGCTPDQIRAALGSDPVLPPTTPPPPPPPQEKTQPKLYTPQQVRKYSDALADGSALAAECWEWLNARGYKDWSMVEHYRLGMVRAGKFQGITIPIPADELGTHYYVKTRRYPFDTEPKWSQKGVPATVFYTYLPTSPALTILCGGEWDAMMLGWVMQSRGLNRIACASFTCGEGTVPPREVLDQLRGQVAIFYDLDDAGQKGASKLAAALGDRAIICTVPAPDDHKPGWDISDALDYGYEFDNLYDAYKTARDNPQPTQEIAPLRSPANQPQTTTQGDAPNPESATVDQTPDTENDSPPAKYKNKASRKKQLLDEIREIMGDELRYNALTHDIEYQSKPFKPETAYLWLLDEYDISGSKELISDWIINLAKRETYSPVTEYLDKCAAQYGDTTTDLIESIATRYFGTTDPLYDQYLKLMLVGAVARAKNPGCPLHNVLILQGRQGCGKSRFLKTLAGPFFDNSSWGDVSDVDQVRKLHRAWMIEWAEIEHLFGKRTAAEVKAMITCAEDVVRVPYERNHEPFPRPSIICGSTNEDEFLSDHTGSRRFWIVKVATARVDIDALTLERDALWAAAVSIFNSGASWFLREDDQAASELANREFAESDPWEEPIRRYLADRQVTTISDLLTRGLEMPIERQQKSHQMRVGRILKGSGEWVKEIAGQSRSRIWRKLEKGGSGGSGGSHPYNPIPLDRSTSLDQGEKVDQVDLFDESPSADLPPSPVRSTPKKVDHPGSLATPQCDPPDPLDPPKSQHLGKNKFPFLQIGDLVEYVGRAGGMAVSCRGKKLQVVSVGPDLVGVKANKWVYAQEVPASDLRRISNGN